MSGRRLDAIRVRQLMLLALIDETGSIGEAARRLHLTQPTTSQMLRELEAVLGASLAVRDARGARLTSPATAALSRFRVALREIEEGASALDRGDANVVLRVGMLPLAGVVWVPKAIATIRAEHPNLRIQLQENSVAALHRALLTGALDCAISRLESGSAGDPSRDLVHMPLAPNGLVLVCRRDHEAVRASALEQLAMCGWILPPRTSYTRGAFDRLFLQAGLEPPVPTIESQSFHTNLRIVAGTDLLAIVPRAAFEAYGSLLAISTLPAASLDQPETMVLLWRRSVEALPEFTSFRQALLRSAVDSQREAPAQPQTPRPIERSNAAMRKRTVRIDRGPGRRRG